MFTKGSLEQCRTSAMELFFISVKPYFKNVLNSIELPLGSIFAQLTLAWKSLRLWKLREMILWRWLLENVTEILVYFYNMYWLELLIPPSNTVLKLLVLLFVIKLYARQFLFSKFEITQCNSVINKGFLN